MDPLWFEQPAFYFSSPYAVTGEGDIPIPPGCERFDFELEVAAIVGAPGKNVTPQEGEELVIGYCIMNDWSARDIQQHEMKLSMGPVKGKDTATSLGPWLVTKDELDDVREGTGYRLEMSCQVNGKPYSKAQWSDVYWSFGEMVSYAARGSEVRPGDVLGSGTCGTGCILELAQTYSEDEYPWLVPGDEVVSSIERLGSLRNRIVPGPALIGLRAAT
jgi:fumarylacetoacetate (FAA) hydrolase